MKRSLTIWLFLTLFIFGITDLMAGVSPAPSRSYSPPTVRYTPPAAPAPKAPVMPSSNSVVKSMQVQMAVKQSVPPPTQKPPTNNTTTTPPVINKGPFAPAPAPVAQPTPSTNTVAPQVINRTVVVHEQAQPSFTEQLFQAQMIRSMFHHDEPKTVVVQTSAPVGNGQQVVPVATVPQAPGQPIIPPEPKKTSSEVLQWLCFVVVLMTGTVIYLKRDNIIIYFKKLGQSSTVLKKLKQPLMYIPPAALAGLKVSALTDVTEEHHVLDVKHAGNVTFYFIESLTGIPGLVVTDQLIVDGELNSYIYLQKTEERFMNPDVMMNSMPGGSGFPSYFDHKVSFTNHLNGEINFQGEFENISPSENPSIGTALDDAEYLVFGMYEKVDESTVFLIQLIDAKRLLLYTYIGFTDTTTIQYMVRS